MIQVGGTRWAMEPRAMAEALARLTGSATRAPTAAAAAAVEPRRLAGVEIAAGGRRRKISGLVSILPIRGTIVPRAGTWAELLGGVSAERIAAWLSAALADDQVGAVILDIDSPGGLVDGVPELAERIHAAREVKPIIAVANPQATSAAYWLAAAASEVIIPVSGSTGSIGVVVVHADWSAAYQQAGIKISIITAGERKAEANPYEPLDDEARSRIQQVIDEDYELFTGSVARYRGLTKAAVKTASQQGRVLTAKEAVAGGLADRVGDMADLMGQLGVEASAERDRRGRAAIAEAQIAAVV